MKSSNNSVCKPKTSELHRIQSTCKCLSPPFWLFTNFLVPFVPQHSLWAFLSIYPKSLSTGLCKSKWIVVFSKWDFLGEGNGNPLLYSYLENPMHRGAWRAMAHGVAKSRTRLSNFTHSLTHMGFVLEKVLRFMLALLTSISMSWWNMLPQHSSVKKQFSYLAQRFVLLFLKFSLFVFKIRFYFHTVPWVPCLLL